MKQYDLAPSTRGFFESSNGKCFKAWSRGYLEKTHALSMNADVPETYETRVIGDSEYRFCSKRNEFDTDYDDLQDALDRAQRNFERRNAK